MDCTACHRLNYFYQNIVCQSRSTAYYCEKKPSTRTKKGLKKLYNVRMSNSCGMFQDKKSKLKEEAPEIILHSKGFFKQKIW